MGPRLRGDDGYEGAPSCSAIGAPPTVRTALQAFIQRTGADELMITSQVYDHAARLRSYEIAAEVRDSLVRQPRAGRTE